MSRPASFAVRASSALSASSNSRDYSNSGARNARVVVKITAVSGSSPTVTVKVQGKTKSGVYYDVPSGATSALGSVATTVLDVTGLPATWRLVYTLGGTSSPTVTFTADVETLV